jgi:LPXTG-motif cell wall-anchored protein
VLKNGYIQGIASAAPFGMALALGGKGYVLGPQEPLPKTGDSKTIVVIAPVVLILAGGAVLWLRKRGKDEEVAEPTEEENA